MIALSRYQTLFPNHFTKTGSLKQNAPEPTIHTWSPNDSAMKSFLGFFTVPISFYIFEDTTRLQNLSYPALTNLDIIELKVPNKASTSIIDAITHLSQHKHVSFSSPYTNRCPQHSTEQYPTCT